jgi:hypothetical protein
MALTPDNAQGAALGDGAMTTMTNINQAQVDRNFEVFQELLPELMKTHAGKFALMHDGKIEDFFDSLADAVRAGKAIFGENGYSVQEVVSQNINLGYYTYALHHAAG